MVGIETVAAEFDSFVGVREELTAGKQIIHTVKSGDRGCDGKQGIGQLEVIGAHVEQEASVVDHQCSLIFDDCKIGGIFLQLCGNDAFRAKERVTAGRFSTEITGNIHS